MSAMKDKMHRNMDDGLILGVCMGISSYFNVDVTFVRLIALILLYYNATTMIIVYMICAMMMPTK